MARERQVKPEFFTDEDLHTVSYPARLLMIGLWTLADREGRLEDRPLRIAGTIFPNDNPRPDVDALLAELARPRQYGEGGFIERYVVDGKRLIYVRNLKKHQRFHPREAASKLPAPPSLLIHASNEKALPAAERHGEQRKGIAGNEKAAGNIKTLRPSGLQAFGAAEEGRAGDPPSGGDPAVTDQQQHPAATAPRRPPATIPAAACSDPQTSGDGQGEALTAAERMRWESEGNALIERIHAATGEDQREILARASTGNGRWPGGRKVTWASMHSDERVVLTVIDLRERAATVAPLPPDRGAEQEHHTGPPAPDPSAAATWAPIAEHLRHALTAHAYATWFRPLVPVGYDGAVLRLWAPNQHFVGWIKANYLSYLGNAAGTMGLTSARIEISDARARDRPPPRAAPAGDEHAGKAAV